MEKLDRLNRLKSAIKSGNQELIDHALDEIKNKGDASYIAPLVAFLHQELPDEIQQRVYQIFNELKHESAVDPLVSELQNEQDPDILERLVAACWQNGLNYSKHLPFFVQLVVDQEFQIAFEAFTVVENMYGRIERDVEERVMDKIGENLLKADDKKQYLLKGLLEIIPHIPLDQDPVDF